MSQGRPPLKFKNEQEMDKWIADRRAEQAKEKANEPRPDDCTCSTPYCVGGSVYHPPINYGNGITPEGDALRESESNGNAAPVTNDIDYGTGCCHEKEHRK